MIPKNTVQAALRLFPSFLFLLALLITFNACRSDAKEPGGNSLAMLDHEVVVDLNGLTYNIAYEHDQFYTFIGVRALAMVHLAIHDVFNAIEPTFEAYAYDGEQVDADPIAAVAEATRLILLKAYPGRSDTIELVCNKWLETVADSEAKAVGAQLGQTVAEKLIALREGDGHEKQGNYTPMTKPGDYQYTPGFDWVWIPDFSYARPFTLDAVSQFRSPPPPALESEEYSASYNEVMEFGKKGSTSRSADQTHYAHWWAEFGEHSWNRIGRLTAAERDLSAVETARMFALLNMNLYDLYLVSFDSKYHYDTWRPVTAIQSTADDGNPGTESDPAWEPEMVTPPWPEYPSAHAAVGAAGAEIVTAVYGTTEVAFTMSSVTAPEGQSDRSYTNLDQAADDCADSRIMNGFHFRFATEEGKNQGRQLARFVIDNYLRKL